MKLCIVGDVRVSKAEMKTGISIISPFELLSFNLPNSSLPQSIIAASSLLVLHFSDLHTHALRRPHHAPRHAFQRQVPHVVVLLLHLRDLAHGLRTYVRERLLRIRLTGTLVEPHGLFDEPRRRRTPHLEREGPIGQRGQLDPEGGFLLVPEFFGRVVELLAELGHVDAEGTEGLSDGRTGTGRAGGDSELHVSNEGHCSCRECADLIYSPGRTAPG
mmetsp:Transcript_28913/g.59191  ORF Transcript_28913/g.59191 Transcript_28913/m.59191 type:complete len:217 (-) Transcript_28913:164-814(-)